MDIHLIPDAVPDAAERAAVDGVVGAPESGWEGALAPSPYEGHVGRSGQDSRNDRHLLLPVLEALQRRIGFITPGGLNYVCQRLGVPPAEAYGVATFYALLYVKPTPPRVAHVCDDIACRMKGALDICGQLEARLGPAGEPALDGTATWKHSPCLGLCELAPAALVVRAGEHASEDAIPHATADSVIAALAAPATARPSTGSGRAERDPFAGTGQGPAEGDVVAAPDAERAERGGFRPGARQAESSRPGSISAPQTQSGDRAGLRLLRRVGHVDPTSLDEYRAAGGYEALRRALQMGPEAVIRELLDSGLQGRGGAAFPTGRKWQEVASAPVRPHYLVCNADESEPGTFKDRVLMEEDPFALVEAMTIAGYAAGCARGYIYVRGEYPLAAARLEGAIDRARSRGFLGAAIMGEGFDFEIEVRRGAGAYICGEETALFNSIEGMRGEPRNKPPYPVQAGLFGKPTLVNNVETLMNVPGIILEGGPAFAAVGTEQSKGPKLLCVCGQVEHPGVYEVPFGTTLRQVMDLAGGVAGGRPLKAILLGGAAGTFVTADELDVPLTFEGMRAIGAALGSGVIMVLDDGVDVAGFVLRIAQFFRDESCGQCVPCRVGTERQEEALHRLALGKTIGSVQDEIILIDDVARVMRDASICGLGPTAPNAVQSAIQKLGLFANGGLR